VLFNDKSAINALIFSRWYAQTNNGYENFNCSNIKGSSQWWNYRGCWHHAFPLIALDSICAEVSAQHGKPLEIVRHCLVLLNIGQFSRLLPSIELWAVYHAHSPASNPYSPIALNPRMDITHTTRWCVRSWWYAPYGRSHNVTQHRTNPHWSDCSRLVRDLPLLAVYA